jgi:hypothetical protein
MDVKKIGRIPDGGGWRAHGRQMGSTSAKKKARIGYDYVHALVDDHSRFAYAEILDDEKATSCAAFFARAVAAFTALGIARSSPATTNAPKRLHPGSRTTTIADATAPSEANP